MSEEANPPAAKKSNSLLTERSWLDYLWIIRDHWLIALLVATAVSLAYGYKKSQAVPLYRSSAILIFEAQRDRVINIEQVVDQSIVRGGDLILRSHLTDLRSNTFRAEVVNSLSPDEIELIIRDYRDPDSDEEPNVHAIIAGANHIRQIGGNIFNIEFHHRNPQAAALLANRFAERFNEFLLDRARRSNEAALRFLRSQSEELKLRVERSELAVQRYRQERNLVSLEESQNLIVERMKSLSASLNQSRLDLLTISTNMQAIREVMDDLDALSRLPMISQMGTLPQKFAERNSLIAERRTLALRYGNRHPRMIANEAALKSIETDIAENIQRNVSDFSEQYRIMQANVANLERALAQAEQESLNLDQIAIEYNVLRRKLETDQKLFTQVHQRLNETLLASQLTDSTMRIVDRAWPAGSPFSPDTKKIYSMSVFLFIFCFGGVPYLIHFLNLNLKTVVDMETRLMTPFLGEIRRFPRKVKDLHLLVLNQTDAEAAELFRQIHSQILLKNKELRKGHGFIITSAIPREGKSFFAINLAASFSRHHYKTLLIDCDFRRPTIADRLNDVLTAAKTADWKEGQPIRVREEFHVLPASKTTIEATELIESAEFRDSLKVLREQYDIVIIDTPPSGLFPDAALIGEEGDQIIFLTQLNKHRKATLSGILNRLGQSKAEVLGMVVNRVSRKHARNLGGYKYSGYGKYKNYYPTSPKDAA